MHFETLQSLSVNGISARANDDRVGALSQIGWVIDGATDLGEPGLLGTQGGAAWLASKLDQGFARGPQGDIETTSKSVFNHVAAAFEADRQRDPVATWELPKAAFAAAQLGEDSLNVGWSADCTVLLCKADGGTLWCTDVPDSSAEVADALALGEGVGAQARFSPDVLEDRRAQRARPDHRAISPMPEWSLSATRFARFDVQPGDEVLVMSDGFSCLVSDYSRYNAQTLVTALRSGGLVPLLQEIRDIETRDAACLTYPRFKVSDDATALWMRVAA